MRIILFPDRWISTSLPDSYRHSRCFSNEMVTFCESCYEDNRVSANVLIDGKFAIHRNLVLLVIIVAEELHAIQMHFQSVEIAAFYD